jgi:hypothetical protein
VKRCLRIALAVGHDQGLGGSSVGWTYLISVIDDCTREIVGWDLSVRCGGEEALTALNQAILEGLPFGSLGAGLTLTTDNGIQFTSARHVEPLDRLGTPHCRSACNHPEGGDHGVPTLAAGDQMRQRTGDGTDGVFSRARFRRLRGQFWKEC